MMIRARSARVVSPIDSGGVADRVGHALAHALDLVEPDAALATRRIGIFQAQDAVDALLAVAVAERLHGRADADDAAGSLAVVIFDGDGGIVWQLLDQCFQMADGRRLGAHARGFLAHVENPRILTTKMTREAGARFTPQLPGLALTPSSGWACPDRCRTA